MSFRRLALAAVALAAALPALAADHRDAPIILSEQRADINDLFVFQAPQDSQRLVMILTVNPFAGVLNADTFPNGVAYQLNVFNDDDFVIDRRFKVAFGKPPPDGRQAVKVSSKGGDSTFKGNGFTEAPIDLGNQGLFWAGKRDDPFFGDWLALRRQPLAFDPGASDFFAGSDVLAMVFEVPTSALRGEQTILAFQGTAKKGKAVDVVGRPLVDVLLGNFAGVDARGNPTLLANLLNQPLPKKDAFILPLRDEVARILQTVYGIGPQQAASLAGFYVPNILPFNTAATGGFFNGRRLDDDVVDAQLNVITNGATPTDFVDTNDVPFLTTFPYLAPPHG